MRDHAQPLVSRWLCTETHRLASCGTDRVSRSAIKWRMSCRSPARIANSEDQGMRFPAPADPDALAKKIPSALHGQPVYCYIVRTIKTIAPDYELHQTGSGPNFAGGRITLCTCKHKDRATMWLSSDPRDPRKDVWDAGLTSKSADPSRSLAYLMCVERSFSSQQELWEYLPKACRERKCASTSNIGDLFRPKRPARAYPYLAENYHAPAVGKNVHATEHDTKHWHRDITRWSRRAVPHRLLLGDANQSYRWPNTKMILKINAIGASAHHAVYDSLREFITDLHEFDP